MSSVSQMGGTRTTALLVEKASYRLHHWDMETPIYSVGDHDGGMVSSEVVDRDD